MPTMPPPRAITRIIFAALLASAAGSSPALAEPPPAATAEPAAATIRDDVRGLHNDALAAFKRKEFEAAYKGFLQAWGLQKIPRIAGNLGRAELALQKYRDAAEHLALFLREDQALGDEERSKVNLQLAEAKAKVGTLRVEATPAGAEVLVDGVVVGTAPLPHELYVEPGRHTVQVRHAGSGLTREMEARAGFDDTIKLEVSPPRQPLPALSPPPPPAPPRSNAVPPRMIVLATGAVVAAGAAGLGIGSVITFVEKGEAARDNREPAAGPNAQAEAIFKNTAFWGFIAAGLASGGTLAYYALTKDGRGGSVKAALALGPLGGGALIHGEF